MSTAESPASVSAPKEEIKGKEKEESKKIRRSGRKRPHSTKENANGADKKVKKPKNIVTLAKRQLTTGINALQKEFKAGGITSEVESSTFHFHLTDYWKVGLSAGDEHKEFKVMYGPSEGKIDEGKTLTGLTKRAQGITCVLFQVGSDQAFHVFRISHERKGS